MKKYYEVCIINYDRGYDSENPIDLHYMCSFYKKIDAINYMKELLENSYKYDKDFPEDVRGFTILETYYPI